MRARRQPLADGDRRTSSAVPAQAEAADDDVEGLLDDEALDELLDDDPASDFVLLDDELSPPEELEELELDVPLVDDVSVPRLSLR